MPFYDPNPEDDLRFGDVIIGFQTCLPKLDKPGPVSDGWGMSVELTRHAYFAVMTPCCSIKNKTIALTPLVAVRPHIARNPYFWEDLLRINHRGPKDKIMPPKDWEQLTAEQRAAELATGDDYALMDTFIYAPHALLAIYPVRLQATQKVEVGSYMIEFGSIFRIDCDQIKKAAPAPDGTKRLQLDPLAREDLRRKIGNYFARIPDEDRPFIEP